MRIITAEQVHEALDYPGLIAALEDGHRAPPPLVERALLQDGGDDFLIWPAWQPGAALGTKLVTIFPGNADRPQGPPTVQAVYLLFDGADGSPQAVIDGTSLTYRKTAADSALGAKYLARADAAHLVMIGAGALAPYLVDAHLAVRSSIARITVWNRSPAGAKALCKRLTERGLDVDTTDDREAAVRAADIVVCATSARQPLVCADWLTPGTHLDLVGAFTSDMVEAEAAVAAMAEVYVDSRQFTVGHCGDLDIPLREGLIAERDIRGDLYDLCGGSVAGRADAEAITLFKNGGGAHLDLMTARFLWSRLGG
jgi:ornithine cyclodeaminase